MGNHLDALLLGNRLLMLSRAQHWETTLMYSYLVMAY
jgi:hypothetical protein